ncbi:antirestriction protein ArdA [Sulfurospirillum sp. 1307]
MLKIFLTDLQAYNEGHLVGKWINLPLTPFELSQALSEVLSEGETISQTSNHEEWFITDYEWEDLEFFEVYEYEDIYKLNADMGQLAVLDKDKLKAIAFLLNEGITIDIQDAIERSEDVIIHQDQSLEDVAYSLLEDCYGVYKLDPIIANNIDYERVARDLEYGGNYWEIGSDVFEYIG